MEKKLQVCLDDTFFLSSQSISWREHNTKQKCYMHNLLRFTIVVQSIAGIDGCCFRGGNQTIWHAIVWRLLHHIIVRRLLSRIDSLFAGTKNTELPKDLRIRNTRMRSKTYFPRGKIYMKDMRIRSWKFLKLFFSFWWLITSKSDNIGAKHSKTANNLIDYRKDFYKSLYIFVYSLLWVEVLTF